MRPQSAHHLAFGQAIREVRRDRGISQEELAHRCDIDRSYMGGVERGERNVSLKNIIRIANALEISCVELFRRYEKIRDRRK